MSRRPRASAGRGRWAAPSAVAPSERASAALTPTIALAAAAVRWAVKEPATQLPPLSPLQLGVLLKAAAALDQKTVTDVARQFGVSSNHLTLVMSGARRTSPGLAAAIADYIGIPVEAFRSWAIPRPLRPARRRRIQVETAAGPFAILAPATATLADLRTAYTQLLRQLGEEGPGRDA